MHGIEMTVELQNAPRLAAVIAGDYRRRLGPVGLGPLDDKALGRENFGQFIRRRARAQRRAGNCDQRHRRVEQALFIDSLENFFFHVFGPFRQPNKQKKKPAATAGLATTSDISTQPSPTPLFARHGAF